MAKRKNVTNGTSSLLYLRVSTIEQLKGVSLEAQEERLRAYCLMTGLKIGPGDAFREEGVSASIPLHKRPRGAELLERVNEGATHVVALKLDRIFRDAEDALRQTKAWDKAGVTLHLVDLGGASLSTASAIGRMLMTVMAGFAELERNLISERTATSLTYKRTHREVFNHAPYGFTVVGKVLVENPEEIAVVNLICERRDDGWTLGMIASALNDEHVPTKLNGRWYARTIKNLLDSDLFDTRNSNDGAENQR